MNEEIHTIALKSALNQIQKTYDEIKWSFIFTKDGAIIQGNANKAISSEIAKSASSFHSLTEKSEALGGMDNMLINGDQGIVQVSSFNGNHIVNGTSKKADIAQIQSINKIVFSTILQVLQNISDVGPTPLKPPSLKPSKPEKPEPEEKKEHVKPVEEKVEKTAKVKHLPSTPSQQFIVDKFGGFLVRADTVQLDADVLERWSSLSDDGKEIKEVEIETFSGRMAECKVKTISDSKLEGRGLIRIPDKTCDMLEVKKGELVRVKPIIDKE